MEARGNEGGMMNRATTRMEGYPHLPIPRLVCKYRTHIHVLIHTDTDTDTDRQTDRQTDTQTDTHTDRHTHTHIP